MLTAMARITLAQGSESALVDRAVLAASAQARAADPSVQRVTIAAGDEGAVHALREASAPNLFGDGVIVVLTGIDAADDQLAAAIRELLADQPDNVSLVLTHPGGVKGKALLEAVKAAGAEVVDCQAVKRGKATLEFIAREFAAHRRKATTEAMTVLYDAIGQDLGLLAAAASQLSADVETNPIDADAVREYFDGVADVSGFAIADAVWERRSADALRMLRQAMLTSDGGRVGPATVSSLAAGLRTLVRVGGMPPGASDVDVAREAAVPPWKVRVLQRQWSRWSGDQRRLAAAVVALADADGAMKGGVRERTGLDPEQKLLALEILVAQTTARA
jgi:DNA polymerase-3 subunit delta